MTRALRNETGSVLVGGLALVAVMTLVGGTLFNLGLLESRLIQGDRISTQTIYCAEAGGARALVDVVAAADNPLSWDSVTQNLTTPAGDCAYVATYLNTASPKNLTVTASLGSVSRSLKWTGRAFSHGIVSGGGFSIFSISGNPIVDGECGSLHVNGDLVISGNPDFSGSVTASGSYTEDGGNPIIGGESGGGRPVRPVPPVDPGEFLASAKANLPANEVFQLMSTGQVLDGNDALITTLNDGDEFRGWVYNPASAFQWDYDANTAWDGTYYLEGSAVVSGNPGTSTTPWTTTIITTVNIEISGNPITSPHLSDTLLVAGGDIKIDGNPEQNITGIIAAHEQIEIDGNPNIVGNIVAEDAASASSLVTASSMSGNANITYNCELSVPLESWMLVWVWEEL